MSSAKPSSFYQARFWNFGLQAASKLPRSFLEALALGICAAYCRSNRRRYEVVLQNLLPVFDGDLPSARKASTKLFRNFGVKLADLWRFEAGQDVTSQIKHQQNWEQIEVIRRSGRGILLVTPHLGNWEFGAPLLARHGIQLQVITQPEPEGRFTEMRQKARERWGIQTVVVGADPFAFLEVIRKLGDGAIVALLVDRPPEPTQVEVQLFGKPFHASIAPAELARATGCALVPVFLPRVENHYEAHLLPEVLYQRQHLGNRPARAALVQQIISQFEPAIRQYADQWYHFVPIWPTASSPK